MRIVTSLTPSQKKHPYPVLTIGAFDGIHLGHQEIIRRVKERAQEKKGTSVLLTFRDHPLRALDSGKAPPLITPAEIKQEILKQLGLDLLVWVPFTAAFSQTEPRTFVGEVLVEILGVKEVWVGFDFAFGRSRQGDARLLQELGQEWGFLVGRVPPVMDGGEIISSTRIRDLLAAGRVADASHLLGRPYIVRGRVVKGRGQGKELGFPTSNLKPTADFLLPNGIYAGFAKVGDQVWKAAISVGSSPTLHGKDRRIEAHILGFEGDLYLRKLEIHFLVKVREERKFPSEQALIQQIGEDVALIKRLLSENPEGRWPLQLTAGFAGQY
jgi:riboflavin kinase / FMN adenylyltransferase